MELLLYLLARTLIATLQALPLRWVARLGRAGGAVAFALDARHRQVALDNLSRCLGAEKSAAEIRALALENFRRIGENFAAAVKTAALDAAEIRQCLACTGVEKIAPANLANGQGSCMMAIGHFGNFELYARGSQFVPGFQFATTYRSLRQPSLNRLLQGLRQKSGCLYFERRSEWAALRAAMNQKRLMLGLLADQHAGDRGVMAPFFGRDCSTSAAPALFALRYRCPLHTAICYRIGLGQWRIEVGDAIPTHQNGQARSLADITLDINRAFEAAIRRDPANWFWVHRRWKPGRCTSQQRLEHR